jgi:ankyrin repeat protein
VILYKGTPTGGRQVKVAAVAICLSFLFAVASPELTAADFSELPRFGSIQEVQAAISHGQSVDQRDSRGRTPLMWAAESNPSPDVIAALCEAGADSSARDVFGLNPLMHAARSNLNPSIVTALLEAGADLNAKNEGVTALM